MARASEPKLMMLDEPAAGLSRAERVALTELLLRLDPESRCILIEHDMDVALRVAEWVTMMHDGRVIVEGTPDEIQANQTRARPVPGERRLSPMTEPLLRVEGLNGYYASAHVLQDVAFEMGTESVVDHRAQRHGEVHPLPRDHGDARVRVGLRDLRGQAAHGPAPLQDRGRRDRLRAAGPAAVPVAHRRRAPAHGQPEGRREVVDRARVRDSSRAWPSARASAAPSSRAASSRCSPSGARCSPTRGC